MILYALEYGLNYEGHSVIGIYSDVEKARAAAASYGGFCDVYRVSEIELDSAATDDRDCWELEKRRQDWERVSYRRAKA